MNLPIELLLFCLMIAAAIAVARLRDLFAAAMLTAVFSLLSACVFTLMDAVDVAFTEAAVGAGISTILILGTLSLTERTERQQPIRLLPFVVVALTGAALLYGTSDMPGYGDIDAPIHNDLTEEFIEGTEHKIHIPNVVTAVLASYRGYDTLGETTVIFAAAVGVMILLGGMSRRRRQRPARTDEGDAS